MPRLWFLSLLAALALLIPAAARPEPLPTRIVAVGDLHGDYDAWLAIARGAGLVDAKGKWAAGNTTLVQLGDVVDRGPDSLKILRQLMKLQREAPKHGGRVIALVGNHEAMMMTGDFRYVHPGEYAPFITAQSERVRDQVYDANRKAIEAAYKARDPALTPEAIKAAWLKTIPLGQLEYQAAWSPTGELGKWTLANPAVAKVGDSLFVHGGISSAFAGMTIEEINRRTAAALQAQDESPTAIISNPQGPLWYRGLIVRGDGDAATVAPIPAGATVAPTIDEEVGLALQGFGVKRIVVGHTPSRDGILSDAKGRLWRADSAISRAYGGKLSYLEIIGDRVTVHQLPRPPGKAWGTAP